ncbi:MAG: DEAD/DEAH box helicase [Nitrosomonas sp.]|nr:DEAD/DEAH box helicase [Nitrosomonas sp.]
MSYTLRPYQQNAVDTAIEWLKKSREPGLIEAFTAAGKSMIIAEIARIVTGMTGKKVLVLQPNKELLLQNAAKYRLTGEPCSIFSASAGSKSVRHNVVFGTALTVKNHLDYFCDKFCLIILDEADASLTPTILSIIDNLRAKNPNLRVLGLTSSPYKLGSGYIYAMDINDKPVPEDKAIKPFFAKQIVHISGRDLLDQGYVSPVVIGSINEQYDTSGLEINGMGKFTTESLDRAFVGQGRKTSNIVEDIVRQTTEQNRVSGLIFASTHKHAEEIYESLPKGLSAIVTDKTTARERERIVRDALNLKVKYTINCNIFTRGSDFPRLDFIALLRATESSALLHQIIGRGVRIAPDKKDCLLLDYAGNIDNHHPDGDLFTPVIKTWGNKSGGSYLQATCPDCGTVNEFSARKNDEGYDYDEYGYFMDLMGNRIKTDYGDMPSHYGRRCYGQELIRGNFVRCGYRWTFKACPHCEAENDIAARHCVACRGEIIDPNQKLIADFRARIRDPYQLQCDKVIDWKKAKTLSKKQEEMLVIEWITEHRKFVVFYLIRRKEYGQLMAATQGGDVIPDTITYRKDKDSGFFKALGYNQPEYKI